MFRSLLALCLATVVLAIVRRDDVEDSKYIVDPSMYPAIMILNNDDNIKMRDVFRKGHANGTLLAPNEFNADCGATLVGKKFAITAAHCVCDGAKSGYSVTIAGTKHKVVASHVQSSGCVFHCKHGGYPNKCDVAILELEDEVSGVTPYPVYHGDDEVGKTLTFAGWGVAGAAGQVKEKQCEDGDETGDLRHAQNVITKADGVIEYVMDKPGDGALPMEGIMESGDSGSPGFITVDNVTYIVGVDSGSDDDNSCNYGSTDQMQRLSEQYTWIQSVLTGNSFNTTVTNLLPMGYKRQY